MVPNLILPNIPVCFTNYDISHQTSVNSPNDSIITDITVGLAGFPKLSDQFKIQNLAAWEAQGFTDWPDSNNYPIDGYTLLVQMLLLDKHSVTVCISETSDTYVDTSSPYLCFGVSYDST